MRMYPREFPSGRRKKPKRRAERRVYEALASADRRGFVFYEWRRGYGYIELDFAVWVKDLGRFALQVKGGRYLLDRRRVVSEDQGRREADQVLSVG